MPCSPDPNCRGHTSHGTLCCMPTSCSLGQLTGCTERLLMCSLRMLQVVRCALENASSVAKTFLMSDVVVTEIPQPEAVGAGAGMGMDGMGGY